MTTHPWRQTRRITLVSTVVGSLALGVTACGGSSKKASQHRHASPAAGVHRQVAGGGGGGGGIPGLPTDALCAKLPVSDAQALIVPKLSAAVADNRLGGCTFLLPGNQIADSNLTVGYETGSGAAGRYKDDTTGTFSAGGQSVNVGGGCDDAPERRRRQGRLGRERPTTRRFRRSKAASTAPSPRPTTRPS